jgi:hypothetical protein
MDGPSTILGRKLMEEIAHLREEYLRPLVNGQASDYPDYKSRTGYLKALHDFEQMIVRISGEEERRLHGAFGGDEDRARARSAASDR